jgi:hypothetical protein
VFTARHGLNLRVLYINLSKPSGHYMYHQFNIQQFYILPIHCNYVFCVDLRTNSDLCHLQHKLIGFYNRDGVCLLRGTDWVFVYNSGQFVCSVVSSVPYQNYKRNCLGISRHDNGIEKDSKKGRRLVPEDEGNPSKHR